MNQQRNRHILWLGGESSQAIAGSACSVQVTILNLPAPASASAFQLHVREGEFLAQLMSRKGAPRGALFTSMCGINALVL